MIWEDSVPTTPELVQDAEVVKDELVVKDEPVVKTEGLPVRESGDKIWLLKQGKKYWVTSAEVYAKLGFKFGDEKEIDSQSLMLFPEGIPLR